MESNGCRETFTGRKLKTKLENFQKVAIPEKIAVLGDFFTPHEIKNFLQF